jgi:SAM-dependent methyltransferase
MSSTAAEIEEFLNSTEFSGYQSVPLPGGKRVLGHDRSAIADIAFRDSVAGKSVLDVGTYYGFLPYEAIRRGASRAVGLEPDPDRFNIAHRISQFNGGYEIVNTRLEDLDGSEQFEVVCLLNVLHHVDDPVEVLRKVCGVCSDTLVVEFCLADDPDYIQHVISAGGPVGRLHRARANARSAVLRLAAGRIPIMAVGNRPYHRVFYFSPAAFRNLMVVHLGLATDVEFVRSPSRSRRMVAICKVAA